MLQVFVFTIAFNLVAQTRESDAVLGALDSHRSSWNALFYNLKTRMSDSSGVIYGTQEITFKALESFDSMRIDLQSPMQINWVVFQDRRIPWVRTKFFFKIPVSTIKDSIYVIKMGFNGKPPKAKYPPWDGGLVNSQDAQGRPWVSIACQGMAGSVWFPCKDHMSDEPDSMQLTLIIPKQLKGISNGRLVHSEINGDSAVYSWKVRSPINNYNIIPNLGSYVQIKDTFLGKEGVLDLNYWVLDYDSIKAQNYLSTQVKPMLRCFEFWLGPYPFYKDGYKLIQTPYLGMEHQSGIAYGNNFNFGYLGEDLSESGWGLYWDYIVVHESGHEWFGNNISVSDVADNWIHEGFTCYLENLFVEYLFGSSAGSQYVLGLRNNINYKHSIIAPYHMNQSPDGDMYYKGANILHYLRQIVNSDSLWRLCLTHLNKKFKHQTVQSVQIENEMSRFLNLDLSVFFNQYLRTASVPVLEYYFKKQNLYYRLNQTLPDLILPIRFFSGVESYWVNAGNQWNRLKIKPGAHLPSPDPNCFVRFKKIKQ